jgi:hypothetical protein
MARIKLFRAQVTHLLESYDRGIASMRKNNIEFTPDNVRRILGQVLHGEFRSTMDCTKDSENPSPKDLVRLTVDDYLVKYPARHCVPRNSVSNYISIAADIAYPFRANQAPGLSVKKAVTMEEAIAVKPYQVAQRPSIGKPSIEGAIRYFNHTFQINLGEVPKSDAH